MTSDTCAESVFLQLQTRLIRFAYRMLGSVADAEDVVQDAWLRWLAIDNGAVREPSAFLHKMVARLCLNELKSARRRRETYIGPWLPEPFFDPQDSDTTDNITLPLMLALERLSPLERAAFLLHDVFGMEFDAVADVIGRESAACRKLASRARTHIHNARPRFVANKEQGLNIAAAFYTASRTGDMAALRKLLADEVTAYADGGGKVSASLQPLMGLEAVLTRHTEMAYEFKAHPSRLLRYVTIDGLPGFVTMEAGEVIQTTALHIESAKVIAIYVIRNPDKLQHLT